MEEDDVEVESEVRVDEFDAGTKIRVMTDGSLRLKLPSMPPSWRHQAGPFESFEDKLTRDLGVEVEGLDREFFGIARPGPDTVNELRACLIELRRKHEQVE